MVRVRRFRLLALALLFVTLGGSPALWTQAQELPPSPEWSDQVVAWGATANYSFVDHESNAGGQCVTNVQPFPGVVAIDALTWKLSVQPTQEAQIIGIRANVFHRWPADMIVPVVQSDIFRTEASPPWATFPTIGVAGLPIGPEYLAQIEILWYDSDDTTVVGLIRVPIAYYHAFQVTNGILLNQGIDTYCRSPLLAAAAGSPDSGIVNSSYNFELHYFPINATVNVRWDSRALDPVQTDDRGEVHGRVRIPAAPMGVHTIRWFTGNWTVSESFTVVPRIKVTPGSVARGQTVGVSLRGYAAREIVRIRWRNGASWEEIARITTSSTGSANIDLAVPAWAADGTNSVRGDAIAAGGGRAQTNAVDVIPAGSIHLSPERGTVNSLVTATLANFPPNQPVTVTFHGFYEATANGTTDDDGQAVLSLRVPASPFGPHDVEATGGTTAATVFDVAPRIKLTPGAAAPGEEVGVSLRGYGAREPVRIRWQRDGSYEQIATVTTSGSGSANLNVLVPAWAEDGPASVRGDGSIGRAQTNAFVVAGGELAGAETEHTPTPPPTATPVVTPSPDLPSPTTESTVTPQPTTTVEPTMEPTASPTAESTTTPTAEATATAEPTPTETPTAPIADDET